MCPNLCDSLHFDGQVYNLLCSFYVSYFVRGQMIFLLSLIMKI